jgi:hypothetical protein
MLWSTPSRVLRQFARTRRQSLSGLRSCWRGIAATPELHPFLKRASARATFAASHRNLACSLASSEDLAWVPRWNREMGRRVRGSMVTPNLRDEVPVASEPGFYEPGRSPSLLLANWFWLQRIFAALRWRRRMPPSSSQSRAAVGRVPDAPLTGASESEAPQRAEEETENKKQQRPPGPQRGPAGDGAGDDLSRAEGRATEGTERFRN